VIRAWARRVFYGWWIVGAGFGLEVLIGALVFHAYGAYVVLLREEFGWSRTLFSAAFAMARAESAFLGPVQGWLTDRFGSRALMRAGMVVMGLGFFLLSRTGSPVTFFVAFFLMAMGSSLGGYLPIAVAIVNWFQRRRALALGLTSSGSAVGGLLTPLVVASLTTIGWRGTALLSGALAVLVGLPAAQIFRQRPAGVAEPPGRPPGDKRRFTERPRPAPVDFTVGQAIRTSAFWLVSLGHGSALLVVSAVMVHMVIHVTERLGYSLAQAATVVALLTVSQIAGHIGGGWAGDRGPKRLIAAGCMVGHAAALLLLAMASAYWMVITFAVIHGLSWGTRGPLMAAIRADYFGSAAFGTISGASSMVAMLGMIGGPLVAGILADRTGSYRPGFIVLAVLAFLGSLYFLLARRPALPAAAKG
jgi:MFS family permease